jgi:TrmH family RNA methyltransferase
VPESLIVADTAQERPEVQALLATVPAARTLVVVGSAWNELAQVPAAVGVLAVVPKPQPRVRSAADFCLLLEDVQDPGNVGSILRSAAAAGVEQVFLSPQCAFAWSPKVLRAAQGAHFHLEIYEDVDLVAWARAYRGKVASAVAAGGEPLYAVDLTGPIAIAIGNEGGGLSAAVLAASSVTARIPMPGGFESLNAAAAAAVCLFECVRQRIRVRSSNRT